MKIERADRIFLAAATILFALRIWLGREISVFIMAESQHDDILMIEYADLYDHFVSQSLPFQMRMIKDLGFPIFLNVVKFSGLEYVDWLAILWLAAAILMVWLFARLTEITDRRILFLVFAFVLFTPEAFSWTGRRLYRTAALVPAYFITLELLTLWLIERRLWLGILLGIIFTWTFYTKEDGVWLLAVLILVTAATIFLNRRRVAVALVPLIIFFAGAASYRALNYKFFGVAAVNNRTEGELGNFLKLVYKIDSAQRTGEFWAPTDAIERAFEVSPTLKNSPELKNHVMHTTWFEGDIKAHPIHGDFLGWVMLSALYDSRTCKSLAEQEEFLARVNAELAAAFESGALKKDTRPQIISSMGGFTWAEIWALREFVWAAYKANVAMWMVDVDYAEGLVAYPAGADREQFRRAIAQTSEYTNMDFEHGAVDAEKIRRLGRAVFKIYSVLNTALFVLALVALITSLRDLMRRRLKIPALHLLILAGFLALSFVYALAISWFSYFIGLGGILMYSGGIIPMLAIFELLGAWIFARNLGVR